MLSKLDSSTKRVKFFFMLLLHSFFSINPLIDIGQCQGAFVMGLGYWLMERICYDPETGRNLTSGTWEYHPPTTKDIPVDFRINFLKDAPNPLGVLGAKGIVFSHVKFTLFTKKGLGSGMVSVKPSPLHFLSDML